MEKDLKFLSDFRAKVDSFAGAVVKVVNVKQEGVSEKDATVQEAHRILLQRYLAQARTAWMDVQELQMKWQQEYD
jgi:hypothetical protein